MKLILEHLGIVVKEGVLEEGREYFIGRQKDCDFVLEEDSGVSRKHLKIYQSEENGVWQLESLSEWGGLYLDGEEIQFMELKEECSLKLKNYSLKFIQEEAVSREEPAELENESLNDSLLDEELSAGGETKIAENFQLLYSLHVFIDGEFSNHISLSSGESWVLGRAEECDICIDYSFLTRQHIQLSKRESKFYIKDLGAANKTLVNGKELPAHQECLLKPNDEISVADLKILFEVRNLQHEALIKNLPAELSGDSASDQVMAFPKVVLEESPAEEISQTPLSFLKDKKKRRLLLLTIVPILSFMTYFKYQKEQQKKLAIEEARNQKKLEEQKLEALYKEAVSNMEQERYQFCKEQLEELHNSSRTGAFRDSEQLLVQCQTGLLYQKQKKAQEEAEKRKRETELKVEKMAKECQKDFEENKIKTLADLNLCAADIFSLDPNNSIIANIMNTISEREVLNKIKEQKREKYRKFIKGKKALYYKAKKLGDQKKALKAVSSYNVFLNSARGVASLKSLYEQAEKERDSIQKEYDDKLSALYESCENLIKNEKMKSAYYDCKKILSFKSHDAKAIAYIDKAKTSLQSEFKPLYEQSLWHESFSRIEEAMSIWKKILEKDIEEGYYYKKAEFQLKKYK